MKQLVGGYRPILQIIKLLMHEDLSSGEIQKRVGVKRYYISNTLKSLEMYGLAHISAVVGYSKERVWSYGEGVSVKECKHRACAPVTVRDNFKRVMKMIEFFKSPASAMELAAFMGIDDRNARHSITVFRECGLMYIHSYSANGREPSYKFGIHSDAKRPKPQSVAVSTRRYRANVKARELRAAEKLTHLAANDPFGLIAA